MCFWMSSAKIKAVSSFTGRGILRHLENVPLWHLTRLALHVFERQVPPADWAARCKPSRVYIWNNFETISRLAERTEPGKRLFLFLQTMQFNLPKRTEKKKPYAYWFFFQIKIMISDILWLNQSLAGWNFVGKSIKERRFRCCYVKFLGSLIAIIFIRTDLIK